MFIFECLSELKLNTILPTGCNYYLIKYLLKTLPYKNKLKFISPSVLCVL